MFFLALFTKEMAIGVPVMLLAIAFLLPETITHSSDAGNQYDFKQRLNVRLIFLCPFLLPPDSISFCVLSPWAPLPVAMSDQLGRRNLPTFTRAGSIPTR